MLWEGILWETILKPKLKALSRSPGFCTVISWAPWLGWAYWSTGCLVWFDSIVQRVGYILCSYFTRMFPPRDGLQVELKPLYISIEISALWKISSRNVHVINTISDCSDISVSACQLTRLPWPLFGVLLQVKYQFNWASSNSGLWLSKFLPPDKLPSILPSNA